MKKLIAIILISIITYSYNSYANSIIIFKDLEIEAYVRKITTPLLKAANIDPSSVNIYLVQDSSLNAFVAGGKNIFVFSGLLTEINSDDELAGVLAHEISHITEGHLVRAEEFQRKSRLLVLASIFAGIATAIANPSQSLNILTVLSTVPAASLQNVSSSFSREEEAQADKHAIYLLKNTDYSPYGMVNFMNKLLKLEGNPNYALSWFSTHPLTETRITYLNSYINSLTSVKPCCTQSTELLRSQIKLKAMVLPYNTFIQNYPPNSTTNLYGIAIAEYVDGNYNKSISILKDILKKEPNNVYFLELLGDVYYDSNQFQKSYNTYLKLPSNHDFLIDFKLAKAAYNINSSEMLNNSLKYLNIALAKNKNIPSAWQIKSIILLKLNKPYEAKLATAEKFMALGEYDTAKYYAKDAIKGFNVNSSLWIEANDILLTKN